MADKLAVRDYVKTKGAERYLNEMYCAVENPEDIPFDALPNAFVLKATHGSGTNIFIEDKEKMDRGALVAKCRDFLARDFGAMTNEPHYAAVPRKIIAERFLQDGSGNIPPDFKLFVFSGRCEYIQVVSERSGRA